MIDADAWATTDTIAREIGVSRQYAVKIMWRALAKLAGFAAYQLGRQPRDFDEIAGVYRERPMRDELREWYTDQLRRDRGHLS